MPEEIQYPDVEGNLEEYKAAHRALWGFYMNNSYYESLTQDEQYRLRSKLEALGKIIEGLKELQSFRRMVF